MVMSLLGIDVVGTIFVVNFIQTVDVIKLYEIPLLVISCFWVKQIHLPVHLLRSPMVQP